MRLADAEVLPFEFGDFADTMKYYLDDLRKLLKTKQEEIGERNKEVQEGVFRVTNDPRRPQVPPTIEPVPPFLNFAPLENAVEHLTRSASLYDEAVRAARKKGFVQTAPAELTELNELLMQSERRLTDQAGLPRRAWYKHLIYAPGLYTGYSPKTMPGVREAIEQKRYDEADPQIARIARALEAETALIDQATQRLRMLAGE